MTSLLTFRFNPPLSSPPIVTGISVLTTTDGGYTYTTTEQPTQIGGLNNTSNLRSVENIPTSVVTLNNLAFNGCTNLSSITLPSSITTIGQQAFDGCSSLSSVTLGNSLTTIGSYAFRGCPITSITFPNTLTTIQYAAFQNAQITSLTIPANLTTINGAFIGMSKITNFIVDSSNPSYSSINGNLYNKNGTILVKYAVGKPEATIVIPNGVTTIDSYAFSSTTSLFSITFPTSITTISSNALAESSLRSITIPSTVTSFGSSVFQSCYYLTSVTLLNSLTSIPNGTFTNCALQSFTFPNGITSIGSAAFQNCSFLKSIIIPVGVTSISGYAFGGCNSLKQITIPSTVTSINTMAFTDLPFPINVYTDNLDNSNAVYTYFTSNYTSEQVKISFSPLPIIPCFNKDTKILTINGYVPIQDLRKGDLVKTINNEFIPINMIGCKPITNSNDDILPNRLFKCSNENYPEIIEDLYITGLHSILVDELTQEQEANVFELFGKKFVTDNKYRLPVFIDNRAKLHEESGEYTIYHIALDHEHELMNYGIYANGLLVETCCIKYLKEHSNMDLIE